MTEYINYNGSFHEASEPILKASNRAFRYGDGLFESIRMSHGKLPFLKDHIVRLQSGMHLLKMNIPTTYSTNYFYDIIMELAEKNGVEEHGRVRLSVFRKEGGLYSPANNDVEFLLEINPLGSGDFILNEKGLNIDVFYDVTKNVDKTAILKTCNSLPYILAALYKQEKGLDDCVLLNTNGRVADTISSNIFIVHNNRIITPPLSESCVRGIMRNHILKFVKSLGVLVEEAKLSPDDLTHADEVFLTNAIRGILWVGKFREKSYSNAISSMLLEKTNEYIRQL